MSAKVIFLVSIFISWSHQPIIRGDWRYSALTPLAAEMKRVLRNNGVMGVGFIGVSGLFRFGWERFVDVLWGMVNTLSIVICGREWVVWECPRWGGVCGQRVGRFWRFLGVAVDGVRVKGRRGFWWFKVQTPSNPIKPIKWGFYAGMAGNAIGNTIEREGGKRMASVWLVRRAKGNTLYIIDIYNIYMYVC